MRLAIAGGLGWTSTGYVGAALALVGLVVWCFAVLSGRRATQRVVFA